MKTFSVLLGLVAACWSSAIFAAPIPTNPVYTSKTRFRIPYRFDAAEMRRLGAREIRLYASIDEGRQWQHLQSVPPETGNFEFQAQADGEYWFAVRTMDAQGRPHPEGNVIEAGLKVIVDTAEPSIELTVRQLDPGRVELAWNASDSNLDASTLKLEFIQTGSQNWQQVSVVPEPAGQTSWSVAEGGVVAVRGSIADQAGNIGRAQHQARVEPASQTVPVPSVPNFREPIAGRGPAGEFATSLPAQYPGQSMPTADPFAGRTYSDRGNQTGSLTGFPTTSSATTPVIAPSPLVHGSQPPQPLAADSGSFLPQANDAAAGSGGTGRHRVVNSNKFQIGYKIEDVGPSGVSRVEMFITEDDGRKWWKYGDDADHRSPFNVEVPADGTYGFELRVRSGVGLAEDPPQPGDKPSIVVVVDQSAPQLELMPLQQGQGSALNKVHIQWRLSDANPAPRPVSLSYAASPNGPWEPISGWLEDTGNYVWTVGPGAPARLYVRLTARDAAGNETQVQSQQPVLVDLAKPSARIVDVESVTTPR